MQSTSDVRIKNIVKTFGDQTAVNGISLDVPKGAFVTLLGPSGCGKTTTLRMIGGFEHPDSGEIEIHDKPMGATPPHARDTSMVFQNYALFPHLSVYENVAFGLRERKVREAEVDRRVRGMLDLVKLTDLERRKPGEISGGQQQRVSLARSLVLEPTVLLLDEPLGALDHNLRKHMQNELKRIQQRLGITFIYVTHDQEEALTMSDRIVVMRSGRIEQEGSAAEVFTQPASRYVAEFMGAENVIPVDVQLRDAQSVVVQLAGREVEIPALRSLLSDPYLVIRPERILIGTDIGWKGQVIERLYKGAMNAYRVRLEDGTILVVHVPIEDGIPELTQGDGVTLDFRGSDAVLVEG